MEHHSSSAARPRAIRKAPTGIQGLDEITDGGLPYARPTLICGGAGSGKTLLAASFLVNGVEQFDEPGVLMTFEENGDEIASDVASLGFDLPGLVDGRQVVRRLRAHRAQRDRRDRRIRPGGAVRPPGSRDPLRWRQAGGAGYDRVAVFRAR